jgi:hypothetical protein
MTPRGPAAISSKYSPLLLDNSSRPRREIVKSVPVLDDSSRPRRETVNSVPRLLDDSSRLRRETVKRIPWSFRVAPRGPAAKPSLPHFCSPTSTPSVLLQLPSIPATSAACPPPIGDLLGNVVSCSAFVYLSRPIRWYTASVHEPVMHKKTRVRTRQCRSLEHP